MRLPLTLLAALIAASFIASSCRDNLPPGPKGSDGSDTIAMYRFNGDAADLTGHGHDGTLHSMAFTDDRFGHPNSALLLNGTSSYVSVANKSDISFTADQSFTLSAWVKADTWQYGYVGYAGIVTKGPDHNGDVGYQLSISGSRAVGQLGKTTMVWGKTDVTDGRWHMLTYVVDAHRSISLYVDAQLDTARSTSDDPSSNKPYDMYFGADETKQFFLNGAIDDIAIFRHAMTQGEITARLHEGGWNPQDSSNTPPDTTNPTGTWTAGSKLAITGAVAMCWPTERPGATGYAVGIYGQFCATFDSGKSWTKQNTGIQDDLFGVDFASESLGLAVGGGAIPGGVIIRTTDFGKTWLQPFRDPKLHPANSKVLNDVKFFYDPTMKPSMGNAIAVGADSTGQGIIVLSHDGGQSWTVALKTNYPLYSIAVSHSQLGQAIVVGDKGQVYTTTDAGLTWADRKFGSADLRCISLDPSTSGSSDAAVLSFGESCGSAAYWTSDFGNSWRQQGVSLGYVGGEAVAAYVSGPSEAWAVAKNGNIWYTSNKGVYWATVTLSSGTLGKVLRCITAKDNNHIATAGEDYSIFYLDRK